MEILDKIEEFLNELEDYDGATLVIKHIKHEGKEPSLLLSYSDRDGNLYACGKDYGTADDFYSIGPFECNGCHRIVMYRIKFTDKLDLIKKLNLKNIGGFKMNKIFCKHCMDRVESDEDIINKLVYF